MKKKIILLATTTFLTLGLISCNSNQVADLVAYGSIFTAEDVNSSKATAFAVKDGKYIYVGNKEGAQRYVKEGYTNVINLEKNGLIIPGATEGHGHFLGCDSLLRMFPGYNAPYKSTDKDKGLLKILEEVVHDPVANHNFFLSWGLVFSDFSAREDFTKTCYAQEIQDICPDMPVVFIDNSGHQALCNFTALKMAGLYDEKGVHQVRGGNVILMEDNKTPNGWVNDELVMYVFKKVIDLNKVDTNILKQATTNAIDELHSRGYTNYLDAYLNMFGDTAFAKITSMLDSLGGLTANVAGCYTIRSFDADRIEEEAQKAKDIADQYFGPHFNPYNIKLFADGVTESRTGWTIDEYPDNFDRPLPHGNQIWSQDELNKLVIECNKRNLDVHTHAFGDAACKAMIDSYVNSNKTLSKQSNNSLGHVRNITKEDITRCAQNNISIAANLVWHTGFPIADYKDRAEYDEFIDMLTNQYYPKGLYKTGYPMKSLMEAGVNVSSSTDAPATETVLGTVPNIVEVAVTGMEPGKECFEPFNPSELISVKDALKALTINGAKQLGIDDRCGSIKVGKSADFLILDKDFLDYKELKDLKTIHETRIESVYFEGKNVN